MHTRKFLTGILIFSWLAAPPQAGAQEYGYMVNKQWQKVLGLDHKKDGIYRWFGYPVDNFGLLTAYKPPIGKQFADTDRICATWSCIEVANLPGDMESLLTLEGYAELGGGGSFSLSSKQQKSMATGLVLPQLARMLGMKGKVHWSSGVQVRFTADKVWKRSVNVEIYDQFIHQKSTSVSLTEVWGRGNLIYIGADILAQNVSITLTVDPNRNAAASAALTKAASALGAPNSANVTLRNQGNGTFLLKIPTYMVLAVQVHHQYLPNDLRSSEKDAKKEEKALVEMTHAIPQPKFDPTTVEPIR